MQFSPIVNEPKNVPFTQIPDKAYDMIFLKSPKTLFLYHFWQFLVIFAQVTPNFIWAPNTMLSFRKNWRANSDKTYRQTERRMDGWRTPEAENGGSKIFQMK